MVNFVAVQKLLLHRLMKWAGLTPQTVEIDPMTVMNMWVPLSKTKAEDKNEEKEKPAVVLIHGFAADGVVTWEFQVGSLAKEYAVYVPDLIFFGASTTDGSDRSPAFQAEMVVRALGKFGVRRCAVVGFSYGGMVAIKMAELWPEMVTSIVVSGSVLALTESISETMLERIGFSSWSEFLLPNSVKGVKAMFSIACYKKLWFPDRLFRDYLQVMFTHRKERKELLESLVISNKDLVIPNFSQPILLLWGENDQIFNLELAKNMKESRGLSSSYFISSDYMPKCLYGEMICLIWRDDYVLQLKRRDFVPKYSNESLIYHKPKAMLGLDLFSGHEINHSLTHQEFKNSIACSHKKEKDLVRVEPLRLQEQQ